VTRQDADDRIIGPGTASDGGFDVRIIGGGPADEGTSAAIAAAVARVLGERDRERTVAPSAWALAGRIEARDGRTLRSRNELLGVAWSSMTSEAAQR